MGTTRRNNETAMKGGAGSGNNETAMKGGGRIRDIHPFCGRAGLFLSRIRQNADWVGPDGAAFDRRGDAARPRPEV